MMRPANFTNKPKPTARSTILGQRISQTNTVTVSDDERQLRSSKVMVNLAQNDVHITEMMEQFAEFLEASCRNNTISPELLASFSRRLKKASDMQKSSKSKTRNRAKSRGRNEAKIARDKLNAPINNNDYGSESGSDIPLTPGASSMTAKRVEQRREKSDVDVETIKRNSPSQSAEIKPPREQLKKFESMGNIVPPDPPSKTRTGYLETAQRERQLNTKSEIILRYNNTAELRQSENVIVANADTQREYDGTRPPLPPTTHLVAYADTRESALLLQALRQSVVAAILRHSHAAGGGGAADVNEELTRLLNALASFRSGRHYLLHGTEGMTPGLAASGMPAHSAHVSSTAKEFLYELVLALRARRLSTNAVTHALGALQKLSIRTMAQKEMLLCRVLEWLILYLDVSGNYGSELSTVVASGCAPAAAKTTTSYGSFTTASQSALDYALCLLSNLLMNTVAQTTVLRYRHQIVAILSHLLTHKHMLTRQVCRALYCAMGMYARVRQAARESDLDAVLAGCAARAPNLDTHCQLIVVRKLLNREIAFECQKISSAEEIQDYDDYVEAEIDSTDSVRPTLADLFGDRLLAEKFALEFPRNAQVDCDIDEVSDTLPGTVVTSRSAKRYSNGVDWSRATPTSSLVSAAAAGRVPRGGSATSHATFVLENDKRKPLMVPCGFEGAVIAAANSSSATERGGPRSASFTNIEIHNEVLGQSSPPPEPLTTELIKGAKAETSLATSRAIRVPAQNPAGHLAPARSVPFVARIPKKTVVKKVVKDVQESFCTARLGPDQSAKLDSLHVEDETQKVKEYRNVFASRPKIIRTPDCQN